MEMKLQLFGEPLDYRLLVDEEEPLFLAAEEEEEDEPAGDGDGDGSGEPDDGDAEDEEIVADEDEAEKAAIFFPRLKAVDNNLPHTEFGKMLVADEDGNLLSVEADADGTVREEYVLIEDENVMDGTLSGGKLQESTITSRELDMTEIFADSALIKQLLAENMDAAALFENEEFGERYDERYWKNFAGAELSETDLNEATTPGRYYSATGENVENKPVEENGFLLDVLRTGEGETVQVYRGGKKKYERSGIGIAPPAVESSEDDPEDETTAGPKEVEWGEWVLQVDDEYLQEELEKKVNLSGDTMTGALKLPGNPTENLHATPKQYVDAHTGNKNNPHEVTVTQIGAAPLAHNQAWSTITDAPTAYTPTTHASTATTYGVSTTMNYGHAMASSAIPVVAGTASAGTNAGKFAQEGHVHPLQASVSGNAGTATKLATTRAINGTNFDGSVEITTAKWGTARNITIGSSKKSVDGSADASWSLSEIGAAATAHNQAWNTITGVPTAYTPSAHASVSSTYGAASRANYGHAYCAASGSTAKPLAATATAGSDTPQYAAWDHVHPTTGLSLSGHTHTTANITNWPTQYTPFTMKYGSCQYNFTDAGLGAIAAGKVTSEFLNIPKVSGSLTLRRIIVCPGPQAQNNAAYSGVLVGLQSNMEGTTYEATGANEGTLVVPITFHNTKSSAHGHSMYVHYIAIFS